MIDARKQKPIRVSAEGTAFPLIVVPVSRLEEIQASFKRHEIRYYVENGFLTLNDNPPVAFINLYRTEDADLAQAALDEID